MKMKHRQSNRKINFNTSNVYEIFRTHYQEDSTHGRGEESVYIGFWWESQKERDHLGDQGIGGRMVSEWILGRLAGGV
jgi:hypothetical protein